MIGFNLAKKASSFFVGVIAAIADALAIIAVIIFIMSIMVSIVFPLAVKAQYSSYHAYFNMQVDFYVISLDSKLVTRPANSAMAA